MPVPGRNPVYLNFFWTLAALILGFIVWRAPTGDDIGLACLVAFASLLAGYLWSAGLVPGFPIVPIVGATHVWSYALPFVIEHEDIVPYSLHDKWIAAATVAAYLLAMTFVWFLVGNNPARAPVRARVLTGRRPDRFLIAMLVVAILFLMSAFGGWFPFDSMFFTLVKQFSLAIGAVSVFALSVRMGEGALSRWMRRLFVGLLALYLVVASSGLFLVGSATTFFLAVAGYVRGGGRPPWALLVAVVSILSLLHLGKGEMREVYWNDARDKPLQVWEYPAFYSEWLGRSIGALAESHEYDDRSSAIARLSVVNMLLKVQTETPTMIPYMDGSSYTVIPMLLIPRILYPGKETAQEGMILMNIHYGTQTREDAATTAIGWGMLSEAYANFGYPGVAFLAVLLGSIYGFVERWSLGYPVLSARFLLSITVLLVAIQTEFSASIYFTALFQSAMSVLAISFLAMKTVPIGQR
jgi:hypothetical protein